MELFLIVVVVVLGGLYIWYTRIVGRLNQALEALSSIDVQLRKRHDLIPNILKMVQNFMDHESEVLTRITALRTDASQAYDPKDPEQVRAHLAVEGDLQKAMGSLFHAVAEDYPELRSSENMRSAQETFEEVEGHISAARRFYNSSVTDLNNAVQIFPGNLLAQMAGVAAMPYFDDVDDVVRQPINVDNFMK